jgi:hypothetical protein
MRVDFLLQQRRYKKRSVEKDILITRSFYAHLATVQTLTLCWLLNQ